MKNLLKPTGVMRIRFDLLFVILGMFATNGATSQDTFFFTETPQMYVVPPGVTSIDVDVRGADGGEVLDQLISLPHGGRGGRVWATLSVTPLEVLYVFVGGAGIESTGGWNGGGPGGTGAGGGGGASDIRRGSMLLTDRVIVAGGGGGAGQPRMTYWASTWCDDPPHGGHGGYAGQRGRNCPGGGGGTQSHGGSGSSINYGNIPCSPGGKFGIGGAGCPSGGGGGGAGYYGGGGGGIYLIRMYPWLTPYGYTHGGGGGGSNFATPAATGVMHGGSSASNILDLPRNGLVIITPNSESGMPEIHDLGVTSIPRPQSGCENEAPVTIEIHNYGNTTLSGFDVQFSVTGPVLTGPVTENVGNLVIGPGSSALYTFSATAGLSIHGTYIITAQTLLPGDADHTNDAVTKTVECQLPQSVSNDLGVTALLGPCEICSGYPQVKIEITNFGTTSQTLFDVQYAINGPQNGDTVTENVGLLVVPPGDTVIYEFEPSQSFLRGNTYTITARTLLPGDQMAGNDSWTDQFGTGLVIGTHTYSAEPGQCAAVVNFPVPVAPAACGLDSVTFTPPSGTSFPLGTTEVAWRAYYANGVDCGLHFDILVTEDSPPSISCPSNKSVSNEAGKCGASVTYAAPAATDNCGIQSVVSNPPSGSYFQIGTTSVVCSAEDHSGNFAYCAFEITVNDAEPPVINCPANQTYREGDTVKFQITASDNCGLSSVTSDPPSDTVLPPGQHTVVATAVDNNGDSSRCTFTVTVTPDSTNCPGCGSDRKSICHNPGSGNPMTRCVRASQVQSHLNHGDHCGPCQGSAKTSEDADTSRAREDDIRAVAFPNPVTRELNLELRTTGDTRLEIRVYNAYGIMVGYLPAQDFHADVARRVLRIPDSEQWAPGLYTLHIFGDRFNLRQNVIKVN